MRIRRPEDTTAPANDPHAAHDYRAHLVWEGNAGDGTADYETYGREYRVEIAGKPDLEGSADAVFRGDAARHNPEDLFLVALSACHMLSYLALCARHRIVVVAYEDAARGAMQEDGRGGGRFVDVELAPVVTLAPGGDAEKARTLHQKAHELCFIAASVSCPVRHRAEIRVAEVVGSTGGAGDAGDRP